MNKKQIATITVAGTPLQVEYDTLESPVSGIYDYQMNIIGKGGEV